MCEVCYNLDERKAEYEEKEKLKVDKRNKAIIGTGVIGVALVSLKVLLKLRKK